MRLSAFVQASRPDDFGQWSWADLEPLLQPAIGQSLVREDDSTILDHGPDRGQTVAMTHIKRAQANWSMNLYEPPNDARSALIIRNGQPLGNSATIRFWYAEIIDQDHQQVVYRLSCSAISGWTNDSRELCADLIAAICASTGRPLPAMEESILLPHPVAWLRTPRWVTMKSPDGTTHHSPMALAYVHELEPIAQVLAGQLTELTGKSFDIDLAR
jgi:hypothetical protein